jgi:hypothetical protein
MEEVLDLSRIPWHYQKTLCLRRRFSFFFGFSGLELEILTYGIRVDTDILLLGRTYLVKYGTCNIIKVIFKGAYSQV